MLERCADLRRARRDDARRACGSSIGRENACSIRARAGSAVSPPTRTPRPSRPARSSGVGVDAGAAAHAIPAAATMAASVLSTGTALNQVSSGFFERLRPTRGPYRAVARWRPRPGSSSPARTATCARSRRRSALDELTASVLVRRGYADPADARALPRRRAARATTRSRSATCARRSRRSAAAVEAGRADLRPRRLRRRRHLRDRARRPAPARARRRRRLAPAVAVRGGLRPERRRRSTRLAEEGVDLVLTVDCGITAVAEVEQARWLGLDVVVTDHHRPAATRSPPAPSSRRSRATYPFAGLCGTGVVWKLAEALLGAGHPFLDRHLDVVALATVADVVPLARREPRARPRRAAPARADAEARAARADARRAASIRRRSTSGRSASGSRRGSTPPAGSAGPRPRSRCCSPRTPREATRLAEELEGLNRERQAVEERILRAAIAEIESWPEARRRQRGYVVAGEDWHEGVIGIVASRLVERYSRPVVLIAGADGDWKGSGRSVPAFDLHGALAACAAHLERFGGHRAAAGLTIRPERVEAFAAAFAAHADARARPTTTCGRVDPRRRDRPGLEARRSASARSSARLAPFGLGNPGVTLLVDGCELADLLDRRRRQAPALPRAPARPRRRLGDRVRHGRPARPLPPRRALRRRVPAAGEPLERRRRRRSSSSAGSSTPTSATTSCATGSAAEWRAGEAAWTPEARAIFEELELADGATRRSLLESRAFRRCSRRRRRCDAA